MKENTKAKGKNDEKGGKPADGIDPNATPEAFHPREQQARQREQDYDRTLDKQHKYDGTFRPEDRAAYHQEEAQHLRYAAPRFRQGLPQPRGPGYNFGDPYDARNYESGGFGYGGTNGSAGGFGVGGAGPQSGGYGSQANYGEGYFGSPASERDWQSGLGRDPNAHYAPNGRPRGRDHHHESYLTWRDNHIAKLDAEYEKYRAEHQEKFNDHFEEWRNNKPDQPKKD